MAIDFAALAARLLSQSRSLLPQWYPAGRFVGHEFVVGNLDGAEGSSLSINTITGRWSDFASGDKGGDLISLYAGMNRISQAEAARQLDDGTMTSKVAPAAPKPERKRRKVVVPVPEDMRAHHCRHKIYGEPVKVWDYLDADGKLLGHVARYEPEGERKQIVPYTVAESDTGKRWWGMGQWQEPRPLYGLRELAERPDAPVMVVEGEKSADAARVICPQYVVVTWPGGSLAWRKATFRPLAGRRVLLWPDADDPGIKCMWEIGHALLSLCPEVKIIMPQGKPDGWDAADALAVGWEWQQFKAWALPNVQLVTESGGSHGQQQQNYAAGEAGGSSQSAVRETGHGRAETSRRSEVDEDADGSTAGVESNAGGDAVPGGAPVAANRGDTGSGSESAAGDRRTAQRSRAHDAGALHVAGGDHAGARGTIEGAGRDADARTVSQDHPNLVADENGESGASVLRAGSDEAGGAQAQAQSPAVKGESVGQSQVSKWLAWGLDRNGNGLPLTNLNNAVAVLEHDPALRGLVWFDEFLQRLMTGDPAREWTDADDINLALYMQRELGLSKIGRETAQQAVVAIAFRNPRHCVREWLEGLTWDGIERIDHFFPDCFGADDTDYARAASRNLWLSMVARVYKPGCKVDNMIILEGGQGAGKSTAVQIIGGDWFAEQHESATNPKAFAEVLQGKLVIEISEMDAFSRAEVNRVKQVVSSPSDRFRASYARYAKDHPRQGIFIGTTNRDDWNRDETGARRFWPIACKGPVKASTISDNREQLFAEAVARYKAGDPWWEMPGEETKRQQRLRYSDDPWQETISYYLIGRQDTTTTEVLVDGLKLEVGRVSRADQMRVATCLKMAGWIKVPSLRRAGRVVNGWVAPDDSRVQGDLLEKVTTSGEVTTGNYTKKDIPF